MEPQEALLQRARRIPLGAGPADAFSRHRDEALVEVNRALERRDDIDRLIGRNPPEVLREVDRQQAQIVEGALLLESPQLLANALTWLYATCRWHGFSLEFFPAALHAWDAALEKVVEEQDREEMARVFRDLEALHPLLVDALEALEGELPDLDDPYTSDFLAYLLRGDGNAAFEVADRTLQDLDSLGELYRRVIQMAQYRVGDLWQRREVSVAQEHLGTAVVVRVMTRLVANMPVTPVERGRALVATVSNELHEIGARMVADLLEQGGWEVDYLGADTPIDDLCNRAAEKGYDVVALSMVTSFSVRQMRRTVDALRKVLPDSSKIMVGGRIFNEIPELWKAVGADGHAADAVEAANLSGRWLEDA